MDMKRILQAMDGVATKPVAGASDMARFLRVVSEADINQPTPAGSATDQTQQPAAIEVPQVPKLPDISALTADNPIEPSPGERIELTPDGQVSYSGAFGTFVYDKSGKALTYSTPNFNGYGQTVDLATQSRTHSYQQGPMSIKTTTDASGKQTSRDAQYDLGVAQVRQQTDASGNNTNTTNVVGQQESIIQEQNQSLAGSLSKFLAIVDKNDVQILTEGANPHKVALPVQMAMQHYQKPITEKRVLKTAIEKYFIEAEEDILKKKEHRRQLINQYATVIAERVLTKEERMSAAVKLQRAMDRERQKSDASKRRGEEVMAKAKSDWEKKQAAEKEKDVVEGVSEPVHRIALTVTDPNHPMVSKRGETFQRTVRVPGEDREKAVNSAIAHYRRKGYKVHDHHYIGLADNDVAEELDPVEDFLARGGQIQQGKTHKPRKGEKWQGSAHIGAAGGKGTKGRVSGMGANTSTKGGKPVVSVENYVQGHSAGFKPGAGPGIQSNQPIEELVLQKIKPTIPKPIKAKTKTSSCRAGQTQTGVQTKDGKLVPKCSIK